MYHFWYILDLWGEMNKTRRCRSGFTARKRGVPGTGLAARPRQGRPARYRARPHAGAVRLTDWEATGGKPQGWSLGSALVASEPADSPAHPMLSRSDARRAARVYQENAENACG